MPEIYKFIAYALCDYKEIKIIKVISTANDVTNDERFDEFNPIIITSEPNTPDPDKFKFKDEKFFRDKLDENLPCRYDPKNVFVFNYANKHFVEDVNFCDNKSDIIDNKNNNNFQVKTIDQNNDNTYHETQIELNVYNFDKISKIN